MNYIFDFISALICVIGMIGGIYVANHSNRIGYGLAITIVAMGVSFAIHSIC